MKDVNLFEYASRRKLRFNIGKGNISTEDLWDLNLDSLNNLAKSLNKKIKEAEGEEDYIRKPSKSSVDNDIQVSFELVKHVINVKLDERDKRLARAEKEEKRRKLTEALERAENKELEGKSVEDIKKMIEELGD